VAEDLEFANNTKLKVEALGLKVMAIARTF